MNALRVAVLVFASSLVVSFAAETNALPTTITVDGLSYSNVTWRTVTPAAVSITHSTGAATIPLEKLPPELQRRFGYEPDQARKYRAAQVQLEAERQQQGSIKKLRAQNLRKVGNKLYDFKAIEQLLGEELRLRPAGLEYSMALQTAAEQGAYPNLLNTMDERRTDYNHWSGLCDKIRDSQKFCVVGVVRSVHDNALYIQRMEPRAYADKVPVGLDYIWLMNYPGARNILQDAQVSSAALWTSNQEGKRVYDCGSLPTDDELLSLPVERLEVK
jgi:hypothetical protein